MKDMTDEMHESYGLVGLSRVTGGSENLFGSSVRHHNFIRLRLSRAVKLRGLHTNWYHGRGCLIEVDLSPTQFADMITAMNVGDGVPCTIRQISVPDDMNHRNMEPCPSYDQRKIFEDEFDADVQKITGEALSLLKEAESLLKHPKLSSDERKRLLGMVFKIEQNIRANLPFVHEQFTEAMDKTVSEAKGEVEAFVQNKIVSIGIESMRNQIEATAPTLMIDSEVTTD